MCPEVVAVELRFGQYGEFGIPMTTPLPLPDIGVQKWTTKDGIDVLRVHYTADPDKRSAEWIEREKQGMTEAQWEQEMEINFNVPKGKAWYPEFRMDFHVASTEIEPIPGKPVLRGWDFGLTPATLWAQVSAKGQLLIQVELQSWDSGILAHGKPVVSESFAFYGEGVRYRDVGDPAGNTRAQTDEKTCYEILRTEYGIYVTPGPVSDVARWESVRKLLTTTTPDGKPMLLIDPRCAWLIAALSGGYRRRQYSNGAYSNEPIKDDYSHIADCLGYLAAMVVGDRADEDARDEPLRYRRRDVF